MNKRAIQGFILFPLLAAMLGLLACQRGPSLDQNKYDQIKPGMSYEEVEKILGKPTTSSSVNLGGLSSTTAKWENKNKVMVIQFFNNEVKIKHFSQEAPADGASNSSSQDGAGSAGEGN